MKAPLITKRSDRRFSIQEVREALEGDWPAEIYRVEVLSGRIRAFRFSRTPRWRRIQILHSLLGIELKLGCQRINVPDLATARYLAIFARLGVRNVAVPYDITRIAVIADRLEGAHRRLLVLVDHLTRSATPSAAHSFRRRVLRELRADLMALSDRVGGLS